MVVLFPHSILLQVCIVMYWFELDSEHSLLDLLQGMNTISNLKATKKSTIGNLDKKKEDRERVLNIQKHPSSFLGTYLVQL